MSESTYGNEMPVPDSAVLAEFDPHQQLRVKAVKEARAVLIRQAGQPDVKQIIILAEYLLTGLKAGDGEIQPTAEDIEYNEAAFAAQETMHGPADTRVAEVTHPIPVSELRTGQLLPGWRVLGWVDKDADDDQAVPVLSRYSGTASVLRLMGKVDVVCAGCTQKARGEKPYRRSA